MHPMTMVSHIHARHNAGACLYVQKTSPLSSTRPWHPSRVHHGGPNQTRQHLARTLHHHAINQDLADSPVGEERPPGVHLRTDHGSDEQPDGQPDGQPDNPLTPSWDLVAIALVYSVQGLLGLSRLAVSFFFKDELNIQPTELALLTGIALSPWVVKPLYVGTHDAVVGWL